MEDAVSLRFDKKVFRLFDQALIKDDILKSLGGHEMVAVRIDVTEL